MTVATLTVACVAVLLYTLVGRWLAGRLITAPMIMLVCGAVAFLVYEPFAVEGESVHLLAELTLVLILFHDACTVKLRSLRDDIGPPLRLLAIGFPIALIATWGAGWWLLPSVGVYGALLIAAAITPTDAGLGAPTVLNPVVPVRIRRALNVESGLNDGLATPIVMFALTALATAQGDSIPSVLEFAMKPILLALVVGVGGAIAIAVLLNVTQLRRWASNRTAPITVLVAPLALFLVADLVGANVFIAAFTGGLAFGAVSRTLASDPESSHLLETAGDLASWMVWFFAGGLAIEVFANGLMWQSVVVAVLALTVMRMAPVALSLMGSGFRPPTIAFIGWFGPRGLATVVFALLIVDELGVASPVVEPVVLTLTLGIGLSVFAHGISATPLARTYGAWVKKDHPPAESLDVSEPAARSRAWHR